MDVCLQDLHVVFCLDRAGLVGEDGPTHHGVFDLTYLRAIPNLMIMAPADEAELVDMLHTALVADGPVAIRYPRGRGAGVPLPVTPTVLEAGRAQVRSEGRDVALLAIGRMTATAEAAAVLLAERGVSASVVNMRWVKPLDLEAITWAAEGHDLIVTLEENTALGGFGAAVLEAGSDLELSTPILHLGVPDCFVTHGATPKLLSDVGLTAPAVRDAVVGRLASVREKKGAGDGTHQGRRSTR